MRLNRFTAPGRPLLCGLALASLMLGCDRDTLPVPAPRTDPPAEPGRPPQDRAPAAPDADLPPGSNVPPAPNAPNAVPPTPHGQSLPGGGSDPALPPARERR